MANFNSPHFHQSVLRAWANKKGVDIGREGWLGRAFFVTTRPSLGFCIEVRGPGQGREPRLHFPFAAGDRKQRREQFARAWLCYQGEYIFGDYPGKVSLWRCFPPLQYPSFGECLRAVVSGSKKPGYDIAELESSPTWHVWMRHQRRREAARP